LSELVKLGIVNFFSSLTKNFSVGSTPGEVVHSIVGEIEVEL